MLETAADGSCNDALRLKLMGAAMMLDAAVDGHCNIALRMI